MREDFFDALSGYFFKEPADSSILIPEDEDYIDVGEPAEEGTLMGAYRYENPKTGEMFMYSRKGAYRKKGNSQQTFQNS